MRKRFNVYFMFMLVVIIFQFCYSPSYLAIVKGKISKSEFFTFPISNDSIKVFNNYRLHTKGAYVCKKPNNFKDVEGMNHEFSYRVYKFYSNGKAVGSIWLNRYPDTALLNQNYSEEFRYRVINDSSFQIEAILVRDFDVFNIIINGKIFEDSIRIVNSFNLQRPKVRPRNRNQVYVYDPELQWQP